MSDTGGGSATSPTPGMSDSEGAGGGGRTNSASGLSRTSGTSRTSLVPPAPTTTISTIAVQSGTTRIVIALLQSAEWLELRVVELTPGMVYLGANLEEATQLLHAHEDVLTKLQVSHACPLSFSYLAWSGSQSGPDHPLSSPTLPWSCPQILTLFPFLSRSGPQTGPSSPHPPPLRLPRRAQQYSDSMDAAERAYTDNVMPNDAEGARQLLSSLHDHKRAVLEASMYTLQEAQALLARLRGLSSEGATLDSRPLHIKTNIEFVNFERIINFFPTQDLTEAVTALKQLRDEVSQHQGLGESQSNAEILYHDHIKREVAAKEQQDRCIRLLKTAENMASGGHYAGVEARSRAYSVLEAATALHETCDTRTALLQQAILFFRLAQTALTKLDQAEVQVAGLGREGPQRLSLVLGVVEEAVQPALTEGYAILEVTGGRNQPHNMGISLVVEELERRRSNLSSICVSSTEQVLQRTELSNAFLEQYNTIESWLVRIGDAFLQGHQDPGGSLSLAKDFLHLHQTLSHDVMEKKNEIDALSTFLDKLLPDLSAEEGTGYQEKMQALQEHWAMLKKLLDVRIIISEKYVKFHEDAEAVNNAHEALELLLKEAQGEDRGAEVEAMWEQVQKLYLDLCNTGKAFCQDVRSAEDPYLDSNRAVLCVESILEHLGKRRLVITDLHSHFHMKITATKEMMVLWKTYRENVSKMQSEMSQMETDFCPLLRGNTADPEGMANTLEQRLNIYVSAVKKTQEDIQNMMTRAEVMSYKGDDGGQRDEVIGSLLQLYQNLQNKATEYQILGHMLIQWCRNIAEIHRSCDKLESQFSSVSLDIGGVEGQLREHEASKQAVLELMKFAQNEADSIISKIKDQCPPEAGAQDVAVIEEMLKRRGREFETVWLQHQYMLERQLKRSQYHVDLQVISDQLRDLSEQLSRMRGHYGDSLAAATNMQTAFNQFLITVDMLENRIQTFVSTTIKMLGPEDDSGEVQEDLAELEKKWSTFQMQVGQSKKSIELSIVFYKLVEEVSYKYSTVLLFCNNLCCLVHVLIVLYCTLSLYHFNGECLFLFQVEVVNYQNAQMLNSFTVINRNFIMMVENLRAAEEHREKQKREKEELAASLAAAQAEAEAARLAAIAAEEARKAAEEVAKTLVIPVEPIVPQRVCRKMFFHCLIEITENGRFFIFQMDGRAGQKFKLECHVTGLPSPTVTWFHNTKPVKETPDCRITFDGSIATLVMSEAFPKNAGTYTVVAKNSAGEGQCSANVSVKGRIPTETSDSEVTSDIDVEPVKPTVQLPLKDTTVKEGKSARLDCVIIGQPEPEVIWYHDDKPVKESNDFKLLFHGDRCSLIIQEAFLEDAGIYRVVAMNSAGEASTACFLNVDPIPEPTPPPAPEPPAVAPRFSQLLVDNHVTEGNPVTLRATVTGQPKPTISWFRESMPLIPDNELQIHESSDGSVSATIHAATLDHTGQYEIVASNTAGTAKCVAYLSIEPRLPTPPPTEHTEPPVFTKLITDTTVLSGGSVKFEAEVQGLPMPTVSDSSSCLKTVSHVIDNSDISVIGSGNTEEARNLNYICIEKYSIDVDVQNGDAQDLGDADLGIDAGANSSMNVLGKDQFADMMLKFSQLGCFPLSNDYHNEQKNNKTIQEEEKDACNKHESISKLSKFHDMKILDFDTYSRFMMENIVVYGSLDDTGEPGSAPEIDQFCKFNDIEVMPAEDYSNLIVSDCESSNSSIESIAADERDKRSDTLSPPLESGIYKTSCFLDTGISESLEPVKLADLWDLIKDRIPNSDVDNENQDKVNKRDLSWENDTDSNKKSSSLSSDLEPESGYFSGTFSSHTVSSESSFGSPRSGRSKRNSYTFSSEEEPSRISSPSEDKLMVYSAVSGKNVDDNCTVLCNFSSESPSLSNISRHGLDIPSSVSSKNMNENGNFLDSCLTASVKVCDESTKTCDKECKSIIDEAQTENDFRNDPSNHALLINSEKSEDAFTSSNDLSLDISNIHMSSGTTMTEPEDDEEIPLYKLPKKCAAEREHICGNIEIAVNRYLTPSPEYISEYLRCPSSLSVISEESYVSDYEDISKGSNDSNNNDDFPVKSLQFDISRSEFDVQRENLCVVSENSHIKDELSLITGDSDKHEIERRARRAARLTKLRELTKILQTPSKISKTYPGTAAHSDFNPQNEPFNLHTCPSVEKLESAEQLIVDFGDKQLNREATDLQSVESGSLKEPSKAFLFIIKTVERLSQLEIKKMIMERLRALIEAGQSFIRAYVFPFSHATFIDLTNPSLMYQSLNPLTSETAHSMVFETCLHAARGQGAILDGECIDRDAADIIQAGYYLIYILYYKDSDETSKDTVHWTLNDCPITGQEYLRGHLQYVLGSSGNMHSLELPTTSVMQAGRVAVIAENSVGKAVSAATLNIVEPAGSEVEPAMPAVHQTTREESHVSSSTSSTTVFQKSTVMESSHFTKVVSDGTTDEKRHSMAATSTSHVQKATGQPTVEVHGAHLQEMRQEGTAPPVICDKVSLVKREGEIVTQQISQDTSTAAFSPPAKKILISKKKSMPARFVAPLQGVITKEGSQVTLECIIDGFPDPSVTWTHNGGPLSEDAQVKTHLNKTAVIIPRVNQSHSGHYTCLIENETGSAQCTCDVIVKKTQFPPVISKRLQPAVVGVNERLHLEIDVTGTPSPDVSWTKDGQPIRASDHIALKSEGTRHLLVIQLAEPGDSGRYGVIASNPAGRAESLADVMVTQLILDKAPPTHRMMFTDVTDEAKRNIESVEEGHVKTIKRAIEEVAVEAPPSSSPAKILKAPVPKPSFELPTTPQAPPIPVNVPQAPLEPMREEELEVKRLPGKLKKAWPPPPLSDDEADHIPKIDTSVEITSHNVSSIISSFSATSEMQSSYISHTAVPKQPSKPKPQPKLPDELNIELEPEPAPEYGFIPPSEPMVIEEPEPELQQEITPASQPDEGYTPLLDPMLVTEPEPDLQHKIIPTSQPDAYYMPPSEPMLVPEPEPEYLVAQLPEPVHVPEPHIESLQTYKSHKIKDVMVAEHFESGSQLRQEYKRVSAPIVETYKILSPVPEVVPEPVPTPEPCKAIAQEQFKAATPEPPRVPSPEPPKVPTPEPPRVPTPEPPRVPTPEPPRVPTPEPPKVPTPEPPRVSTPEPPRIPTPEPPRIPTPEPPRLPSPEPPKVPTPEPPRVPTPEPPKVPTPEPPKVPTPEPPRVPTPEPPKVPTPEPPRVPTPEPPKVPTPEPPKVSTPEPPKVPTPEPPKAPTPEPPKVPTPEPPKVPTPEPLRVPTPEPPKVPSTVTVVEQITKESYQEPKIEKEVKMETSSVETSFYESKKSLSKTSYSTVETKVYTTGLSSPPVEQVVNAQDVILHPSPLEPSFEISGAQDLIISESAVESLPVQAPDAVVVDKKLPSEDDLLEYFVPESEQVIEFIPTPEPVPREPSPEPESSISEQAFSSRPEVGYISDMKHEKFPSDVSASLISSSVGREMQTMFVSSSNVQTKVFSPLPPQETVEPTTLESQKPERQPLQPLIMPDYHHPEQENIEESIKPPKRPERDEVKEQRKPKKKRESVIQLAKRLEESIPMSPDEVPGGVRMFPSPKQPSTPVRDVPTPTRETLSAEDKMFADLKGEKFPELEPFPFTVEERPRKERPRSLPPPMPRKFIPGSFTDSEYESDMETEHRIQLKKIKFEVQEPTPRPASAGAGQEILPPSAFDTPPVFEGGMRPEILKKEEVVKKEPKSITPKKKTKIVEKFLATAGKSTEQEIAKPVPKKLTKKDTKPPKAVETIEKLPQLIVEEKHVGKPSPIVPEQIDIEFAGVKSPGKLVKSWPPQPDSQLTKSLKMDRSFVTQQQTSSVSSFSETKTHKSSVSYETKESKVVNYSHHTSIPVSAVVPECAPEPAHQAESIPEYILQPEPAPEYIQPEPTPQYIQPEPAPEYIQPEPAPVYVQPEPAPEYIQPEPAPEYSVQLEPAPVYVHPEPAPVYVRPEPAPVYVQPEPTPEYILQPEPAPEYIVQPEPAPEFIVQPEPVPEYILQPEPVQEYAAQPKPATVSAPEPLVEVVPAPGFRSVRAPTSKTTKIKSSPAPPPPFDMTPPELSAVSKSVKSEAKTTIVTKTAHESVVTQDKKTVSKPTVQTMTKPMVKPVTKPKVKPVTEPTVKPVTKPTVKPVTEPTIIPLQKPEPPSQSVSRPLWISKKVGAWPPSSHDETPNAIPTLKTRSQSAERPRVTESATLPARPHEAPPAIYWSSNVTLQEKRMLGLQVVPQVETVTSTTVQESSSMTSRQMKKMSQTSTKQIKTDMTVQQRKPTPVSVQSSVPSFKKPNIQPKKEVFVKSSAPSREISVVSPLIQLPPLEPFPFSVELEKEKKPRGKAPSMPKKFYPGSFTESEYESDYDSKSGSYSRLYMSDSEAVGYRPMNIKMKKGRTKKPKQPSPPPPSTFGPPPPFETRLLPLSLCFSDVESDIPTSRESTPVPRTVISQSKHIIHSAKSLASQITPENKPVKQQERFIQKKAPIITPAPAPKVTPLSPTKPSPAVASKVPTVTSKPATVTISKTVKEPPGTQMTKSVSSVTSAKNIHTNVQHVTSEKHVQITEKQERGVKSMKKMFEGSGPVPVPQGIITSPHVPVPSVVGIKPLVSSTGVKPVQIPTTAPSTAQVSQPSEASVRYIPVACETNGTEKVTSSNNIKAKPSSPKSRKKMENTQITAQELEESGYAADTEGTLPRRSTKTSQSMNSSNFSSSFSKSESFMSSSFSKSESKSFTSSEFGKVEPPSFASGFGIPASDGFPPEGGFPSGSFSFPSTPASSVGQTSHFSSSFKSSESKSSQMFTSRSEEIHEERRGGEGPKTTKAAAPPPPQQSEKKPKQKYEEYRKETRGKPGTSSPFSEDTYYAMKDESDVSTGSSRTQKKVEFKSETHVEIMSDKKVEVFESTSVDVSPQPSRKQAVKVEQKIDKKTIEPKIEKSKEVSKSFKQFKEIKRPESQDLKKSETTVKRGEHVTHMQVTKSGVLTKPVEKCKTDGKLIESVQVDSELKVKQIKKSQHEKVTKVPEIHPLKSTGLVKQAVTQQVKEKEELDLKPFPFKVEPEKPKKPRGAVPPQPTKFVKGEFHESDYESDYEGRIPPKWKPSDSDAEDQGYRKIKVSVGTPKVSQPRIRTPTPPTVFDEPPQFEGPPRPKVDFPESETEYEREISPEIIIPEKVEILIHPEPPLVVPKEPKIFKSQLQKKVAPPKRSPSPVLKPGSPPVEDYVPPQAAKSASFSNAIGVESTKITKLADSSKHHQRFLTMQQTTRVIKFTDARSTTTTEAQESRSKPLFKEEPKQKPLPVLEPFPFSPEPERPKRERGAPPPKPKKFQKGEFTESDYESDYEGHIKPKWQPSDSDVEISYNKVKPCLQSDRTPSKTRERTPTPPTVFDSPPESGGPWRPIIEPPEPVTQKEPSSEVLITKELPKKIEPPKKITVKIPAKVEYVERSVSPPLPSPGPTPEEGIIVQETQYVVDKVDLKSRVIAPPMKEIQTYKVKPYTKITERTEKTITNLKLEEELRIKKEKKETKKTIITESEQVPTQFPPPAKSEQLTIETEKFQDLEPFPFEPDKDKPKRQRGPPPPKPKKFIKGEFRESDYDSDYEGRVRPKWKPPDSDVEDPEYTPVRPPPPTERHSSKSKERTPTPPSKFEVPPASGGPLRPTVDPVDKHVVFVKEPSPEIIIPKVKAQPISKISKITPKAPVLKPKEPEPQIPKIPSPPLPEPGPQPLIGYVQVKAPPKTEEKDDVHIKMIRKKVEAKKGFQIDIDITDIYDFVSESDHERREIEHSQTKPLPKLVPFPYEPDPGRPKRQRGPPPPQPKKFMKGEFRGSDYESDYETPIAPKWAPPDSEGEEHFYRRVAPPVGEIGKQRSESSGRDPSPPSKFDQPPHFEGPPRPVLELSDLPRRERRESLEEYSIPRFPMVEFKPFDLEDDVIVHPQGAITTDTETETESHTKEGIDRRYVKSTQKVVSHQFEDMTQTFRHKAQKFAEQLVTEVFAAREGSVPAEPAGEPPSLPEELRTRSVSPDSTAMPPSTTAAYEALSPSTQEPQAYRDESRISEFGTKHIDPETGLIYFKYDFGYEFGVILPGEAKKVDKTKQLNGDHSNDIPIPVIHEKTDAFAKTGKDIAKTNGHVPHLETTGPQNAPAILIEDAASRKGSSTQTPRTDHVSPQPSLQSDISETDREYQQYMGKMIPEFVPKKQAQFRPISGDPYSDSEAESDHPSPSKIADSSPGIHMGPKSFVPLVPGATVHPKPLPFQGSSADALCTTDLGVLGSPLSATPPSTPSTPHSGPLTQPTRPPHYITPLRDLAVVSGEVLRLECVVQADPPVQVTWSKGGSILQNGPDYQIVYRNGVCRLIIPQVFPEDEGVFTCTAVNLLGMDSTSATVCITGEKK
nr:LOW QUALITY PROTEIN: titin-like [Cherax quadricarinatus]